MRHVTTRGLDLIRQFEGARPQAYFCPAGCLTIGYGHLIKKRDVFQARITGETLLALADIALVKAKAALTLSEEEMIALLRQDVEHFERVVLRNVNVPLTDNQFDALVSFAFNVGGAAFQRSTIRRKVNRGEWASVPKEFMRWIWASGKQHSGMIKRRQAEAELFMGEGVHNPA